MGKACLSVSLFHRILMRRHIEGSALEFQNEYYRVSQKLFILQEIRTI